MDHHEISICMVAVVALSVRRIQEQYYSVHGILQYTKYHSKDWEMVYADTQTGIS